MVTGTEIMGAYQGLKATLDILKGLNAAATNATVNEVKVALTQHILDAQVTLLAANESQAAAVRRISDLEQEIVRLKDWSAEKERYQLHAIDGRAFAYVIKEGMEASEPAHWLCTNCFDNRHIRSILQFAGHMGDWVYRCANCESNIRVNYGTAPSERRQSTSITRPTDVSPVMLGDRYDELRDQDS